MKRTYSFLLLLLLVVNNSFSQISPTAATWSAIGNTTLSTIYNDANNGDGLADGAQLIDGQSAVVGQGASLKFSGTLVSGTALTVASYTYNPNNSYVKFVISLFNVTDNKVLATSSTISITNSSTAAVLTTLKYTTKSTDAGDVLQIRYIRNDDGNTLRNFAIDNISLNGVFVTADNNAVCPYTVTPDLPLITSNAIIETEINTAVNKFSDSYLGTIAPSPTSLAAAETAYAALNISISGGTINGNPTTSFGNVAFLKTFAQHLKFNPGDTNIKAKANNTVWWVAKQFCAGTLAIDVQLYSYQVFARPASLLQDFLEPAVKNLFAYTLYQHSVQFEHFWAPTYDSAYQQLKGSIITDVVYNIGDVLLAYSKWQNTADERYRYMRAYKRYLNRFFSYTVGTTDGIKADGTGFHHWVAYNNYMYSFNTAASILSHLNNTSFQVDQDNYKVFRNAFYTQYMQANDNGVQPLATAGRNPQNRTNPLGKSALKSIAIIGGKILGLTTADPVFAGMYNRIYGVDNEFNYSTVAPFEEGFFQFNHAMTGLFRKNNYVVSNKGFSNNMWGAEAYTNQNRYGRYQSYGAQEIIYPGDKLTGNGYDDKTWDWNFNPGTTVIKLPWASLHSEYSRLDELQQKRFVGALNLKNKNNSVLTNNHGDFGMFAMDFQEKTGQGFGTNYGSEKHNSTFTFKKSSFYFDDIIVCLGSGITNNDTSNETVTTLFQRIDNKGIGVNVNGVNQSSTGLVSYSGASNNWLLSNYGTGFYLVSGNDSFVIKKELQKNPNQDQTWPADFSGNTTNTYYTGYINHGKNPSNKNYEYVVKPNSNTTEMQTLSTDMQGANKPYMVYQKDTNAHIVQHIAKKIWGYTFFNAATNLSYDYIKGVTGSCLVMTQYNETNSTLLLSIDNPDIGFTFQANTPSIQVTRQVTLQGNWSLSSTYSGIQILSANATSTVVQFTLVDGLAKEVVLQKVIAARRKSDTITNTVAVSANNILYNPNNPSSDFILYPNPANNILNIELNSSDDTLKNIKIIDLNGRIVLEKNSQSDKKLIVHTDNLSPGIYIIQGTTNADVVLKSKKIIIKK